MFAPINLFILLALTLRQALAYQVIFAVNCGGHGLLTENGISYQKDPQALHRSTTVQIDTDKIEVKLPPKVLNIFETARQDHTITYHLPMLDTGHYILLLQFIETDNFHFKLHTRQTNAYVNGEKILDAIDVYSNFGLNIPVEVNQTMIVENGYLLVNDHKLRIRNDEVTLKLKSLTRQPARLSGILLLKIAECEVMPEYSWNIEHHMLSDSKMQPCTNVKDEGTGAISFVETLGHLGVIMKHTTENWWQGVNDLFKAYV